MVPSPPTPPLPTHPQILIIVIWSEQGSEPEVRVTEGGGVLGHRVCGCHNDASVMLRFLSQLGVRWGGGCSLMTASRGKSCLSLPQPRACSLPQAESSPSKVRCGHSCRVCSPARRKERATAPPLSPQMRGTGARLLTAKGKWESRREGTGKSRRSYILKK